MRLVDYRCLSILSWSAISWWEICSLDVLLVMRWWQLFWTPIFLRQPPPFPHIPAHCGRYQFHVNFPATSPSCKSKRWNCLESHEGNCAFNQNSSDDFTLWSSQCRLERGTPLWIPCCTWGLSMNEIPFISCYLSCALVVLNIPIWFAE